MNSAGKIAVIALLALAMAGCTEKKARTAPPAQAQAPSIDAGKAGAMYPPPLTQAQVETKLPEPAPAPPPAVVETTPQPEAPPAANDKLPAKRKSKPSPGKAGGPATPPASSADASAIPALPAPSSAEPSSDVAAASGEPPTASPIGQLSTAGASAEPHTQKQTADLIASTESGLNNIKRPLNTQEQETANQIKTFLAKAKQALINQDPDGALTLATKAKVLLDELNKT